MSDTPIIYTWKDAGGPGVNLTGNTQNRIKQILKACLVDGYEDKPSAGWEVVHEHPNGFSLTNSQGVINFVSGLPNMNSSTVHIYLLQNVYDETQAILGGDGLCSGSYRKDNPDTGRRHSFTIPSISRWVVVADKGTFVFFAFSSGNYRNVSLYAGQINEAIDGFNPFICLGGWYGTYGDYTNDQLFVIGSCSINPLTGVLDLSAAYPTAPLPMSGGSVDTANFECSLLPLLVSYSGKTIGTLRLVSIAYPHIMGSMASVLKLLEVDDSMTEVDIDSVKYAQGHWVQAGILLTSHEEFR